ncbi:MAG: hypothetical protein ABIR15_15620 [Chitinophagaceae bacterium]
MNNASVNDIELLRIALEVGRQSQQNDSLPYPGKRIADHDGIKIIVAVLC